MVRFYRKIVRVRAEDSPNVQLGLRQRAAGLKATGLKPDGTPVLPGVLSWHEYLKRRETWDPVRQCIGLDAEFYEGAEVLLYPPEWLNRAERLADQLKNKRSPRIAKAIGIDPAEGGDKTTMAAVDELGLIELHSCLTPDTNEVFYNALGFIRKHNVAPEKVVFDAGGGGKQHAHRLRDAGYRVTTVAFGESVTPDLKRGTKSLSARADEREEKYVYRNRRAEMYGMLRIRLDPATEPGFALPAEYRELRRQLSLIPLTYDGEGRLMLLPKNRKSGSNVATLTDLLGRSPDEADAVVMAVYGMERKAKRTVVGAL
jgi:hypothetical protein